MAKSLLLICRQSPWAGPSAREALYIALAGGAFELPLALLFLDDGVFQLVADQNPSALEQKDLQANLRALPLFGVDQLYICQRSLAERGLSADSLVLPAQPLDEAGLRAQIAEHDQSVTL